MFVVIIIPAVMLLYVWMVYPALVMGFWRRKIAAHSAPPTAKTEEFPAIAVLFSAHNEEAVIRQRLENLAALDYPADRFRVYVGVDGGTDRTAEIAKAWAEGHANVSVLASEQNHGKTAMLKKLVGEGSGCGIQKCESGVVRPEPRTLNPYWPLLVFTDANTLFAPDALRKLVAPFADPAIGGVCGRLVFLDAAGAETRENLYWRAETVMKMAESHLDSCLGANGAIYAIRQELFWKAIPDNTIIDDFVIGMKVREQGFRMVYESGAVAYEETPARIAAEWRRRVRIGAGAFQAMGLCRPCLSPRYGRFSLCFWSHKVMRWFTPHLLLLLLGVATFCVMAGDGDEVMLGRWILVAFAGFGGLAAAGRLMQPSSKLKAFDYFLSMQAALFAGFLKYCRGGLRGTWERTERGEREV